MRHKIILSLLSMWLFFIAPHWGHALTKEEIKKLPHISAAQAYYLFHQKKIFLLDVHDVQNKKSSNIIGAYYFPSKKIKESKLKLPTKIVIGVFCK